MSAPETGRTDTISARLIITAIMIDPAHMKAITQPAEPDIAIISPEVTKKPMPIVPENAMATRSQVNIDVIVQKMGYIFTRDVIPLQCPF
jgi:hypothetical protein